MNQNRINPNNTLQILEQFTQRAIAQNLSAGSILLWFQLYGTMSRKGQFVEVPQSTAVLTAQLRITRQGLQKMRQNLVDKGFLAVRLDKHQQIFYTLLLNGKIVTATETEPNNTNHTGYNSEPYEPNQSLTTCSQPKDAAPLFNKTSNGTQQPILEPLANQKETYPSRQMKNDTHTLPTFLVNKDNARGDIILNNQYRPYIAQFCEHFGANVHSELLQWAEMRKKNGWTLTLWGLEAVLKNLVKLTAGNAVQMAQIVSQSIKRRWKGFFPLRVQVQAKPSGAKGIQLEKNEQKQRESQIRNRPWQKIPPEGRDLSFLEY